MIQEDKKEKPIYFNFRGDSRALDCPHKSSDVFPLAVHSRCISFGSAFSTIIKLINNKAIKNKA